MIRVSVYTAVHFDPPVVLGSPRVTPSTSTITYHATIDEWVWWHWYRHRLYEFYCMKLGIPWKFSWWKWIVERLGGEGIFFGLAGETKEEYRGIRRLRSWSINQDFRSYELSRTHTTLATVEISEEIYNTIK